jgi:ribosomal-protein-alanine N-acetyltransferase
MTEAADAMLKFGFENYGFHRITAKIIKENIGSIRVLQKLGFTKEGLLRESLYKNGQYHDLMIFSVLESEYRRTKQEHEG